MNSEVASALLIATISFIGGFTLGQFVSFRKVRKCEGNEVLVPELDKTTRTWPWFKFFLVALFLFAVGFLVDFTYDQRQCNAEFTRTIKIRAEATTQDQAAQREANDALYHWLQDLLKIPGNDEAAQETRRQITIDYLARRDEATRLSDESVKVRNDNPLPSCE